MKRHEALIPLTHDHHHVLAKARGLRMAAERSDEVKRTDAQDFLAFFRAEGVQHFREEEEVIFPLIVHAPETRQTLERVMIEHLQIHALVRRLQTEVNSGIPASEILEGLSKALEE